MKRIPWSAQLTTAITAGATVVAAVAALVAMSRTWIDYLWFDSLGQSAVFTQKLLSQASVWAACALVGFAVLYVSARAAWSVVSDRPRFSALTALGCFILAGTMAWTMSQQWTTFRLAVARAPFGVTDPQFGFDVGFFVFVMPALESLYAWISGLVILALLTVVVIVSLSSRLDPTGAVPVRWWRFKWILSVLLSMLMVAIAGNFTLLGWRVVLSTRGAIAGAMYADVHALLPALWIVAAASAILALVLLVTARRESLRPALLGFSAWSVVALALVVAWPSAMQTLVVAPNEAAAEKPFIARNIEMTRAAWNLDSVATTAYPALQSLEGSAATRAAATLADAPIWTPGSVKQAFSQLQTIRPYYRLSGIDYDRYRIDGRPQQVLVSARQVNPSGLPAQARTWVNTHLVYTHGYGLAVSSASHTTPSGFPQFLLGNVPPAVSKDVTADADSLTLTEPRIYFGSSDPGYAIVNTGIDEFDYPLAEKNVTYRYTADSGVAVGSWPRRIAWALRLNSSQLLFSKYVTPESRVIVSRDVKKRAAKLAPWLTYGKPYPAVVDGRVLWILDAYTASDHYPYSQPIDDGTNYLRNSVKVTVDALSGATTFYAVGDDPVRDAWARIFPSIITPQSRMPRQVAEHLRASRRLVAAQASIYRAYHMTDATAFYNQEDLWGIPRGADGKALSAEYLTLDLPATSAGDSAGTGMYLLQPYASPGRDNLVAWLAVACDPGAYGTRAAYLLPKEHVTLGQQQVGARINQDPAVSQQLTLWNQPGSSVVFGRMLVLPVEASVAYLQPIFLRAQDSAMTELASVVAADRDHIRIGATLDGVLGRLYGPDASASRDATATTP